jgi:DNA-damage-inducible protein J
VIYYRWLRYDIKPLSSQEDNTMASTLVQFRTEDTEKLRAVQILDRLGLSLPAYLRMCVSRLNQENGIPFSMKLEEETNPGIRALQRASRIAEEYGISDMTLEEINAEIAEARK